MNGHQKVACSHLASYASLWSDCGIVCIDIIVSPALSARRTMGARCAFGNSFNGDSGNSSNEGSTCKSGKPSK